MIRYLFLIFVLSLFNTSLVGQIESPNRKTWEEGKLTWEDFQGKPYYNLDRESGFEYAFGFQQKKVVQHDTVVIRLVAYAYFLKDISWVLPEKRSDVHLMYNQVIFDMVEVYRRKLNNALVRANSYAESQNLFDIYLVKLNEEIEDFEYQFKAGNRIYAVQRKQDEMNRELLQLDEEFLPPFKHSNFGIGMHLGFGADLLTGSVSNHFKNTTLFIFGFDFAFQNFVLDIGGGLSNTKVTKEYIEKNNWEVGTKTGLAILNAALAYNVHNGHRFKIAPFVGWGVFESSNNNVPEEEKSDFTLVSYSVIFGMNLDYKLRQRFKLNTPLNSREYTETNVRFRLSVLPVNFYPDLKGYSINLTLGFDIFAGKLKYL